MDVVTKTMSASQAEFHRSMAVLDPALQPALEHRLALGAGAVAIRFEMLAPVTLGTLLALPRARVTLAFEGPLKPDERAAFLHRFDLAFQRGGG